MHGRSPPGSQCPSPKSHVQCPSHSHVSGSHQQAVKSHEAQGPLLTLTLMQDSETESAHTCERLWLIHKACFGYRNQWHWPAVTVRFWAECQLLSPCVPGACCACLMPKCNHSMPVGGQTHSRPQHSCSSTAAARKSEKAAWLCWLHAARQARVKTGEMGESQCWGSLCTCVSVVTLRVGLVSLPLLSVPCKKSKRKQGPQVPCLHAYSTGVHAVAAFQQIARTPKIQCWGL